jgi:hypothetical protein
MSVVMILSAGEAQRLTQRIKQTASGVREGLFRLRNLLDEAKASNAWQVLGFASWTAYLADALGDEPLRVSRAERSEIVGYLAGEGLSTRAIAPIVGVAHKTVARDLEAPVSNDTPAQQEPVAVVMANGEIVETKPAAPIVGLDGKTYQRPEPKAPPVGDAAEVVTAETESKAIGRALVTFEAMAVPAHRERVVTRWWPLGSDAVMPDARALFNPRSLRDIATHIMQLADELEDSL